MNLFHILACVLQVSAIFASAARLVDGTSDPDAMPGLTRIFGASGALQFLNSTWDSRKWRHIRCTSSECKGAFSSLWSLDALRGVVTSPYARPATRRPAARHRTRRVPLYHAAPCRHLLRDGKCERDVRGMHALDTC